MTLVRPRTSSSERSSRLIERRRRLNVMKKGLRTENGGPGGASLAVSVELADHPAEHLDAREEARRLRQMAVDREAEANEEGGGLACTYRKLLRERAVSDDAAFAEYISDLVFPAHFREEIRFANGYGRCLVLAPRGHAKTTLFLHRAARRIGTTRGARRLRILTAVNADAEGGPVPSAASSSTRALRRCSHGPRRASRAPVGATLLGPSGGRISARTQPARP